MDCCIPHEMVFSSGIVAEFTMESLIIFYDKDDKELMRIDPHDISMLYGAYRQLQLEELQEAQYEK